MGEVSDGQLGPVTRIISGGQTGADRAALDWALHVGIPIGGWCPKGRRAEDGRIPDWYPLREAGTADYRQRTDWNMRDSAATVIFTPAEVMSPGSRLTLEYATRRDRPVLHLFGLEPHEAYNNGRDLAAWLHGLRSDWRDPLDMPKPFVLNVAGSRQSTAPRIVGAVWTALASAENALDPS